MKLATRPHSFRTLLAAVVAAAGVALAPAASEAQVPGTTSASELNRTSLNALQRLYAKVPAARSIGKDAAAVLVFPSVTKAGLGIGGQYGEGALIKGGKAVAHYSTAAASYGLQAGVQTFGYAMFFMNEAALKQLEKTDGFEVGVGPSVVVLDEGRAKAMTTSTMNDDVYAFIFGQKGLMAGMGIQGSKITKIRPK